MSCNQDEKTSEKNVSANNDSSLSKEKENFEDTTLNKDKKNVADTSGLDFKSKKFRQGIDFMASGNEPFWSLEIDFSKFIHFKTLNGLEITTPVPDPVKAADANVVRYSAKTEQGSLIIQLAKQECINDMSGEKSDYKITIDAKNNTDKNSIVYKGCGQYLYDYRLHDIWVLESINGSQLTQKDFMKGLPQLEFNLTEKKVFGHTGCNDLRGSMEMLGKKINFGRLITTRMACGNMEFENMYLRKLSGQTIPYTIEPMKLHLQVNKDSVFIYRKID